MLNNTDTVFNLPCIIFAGGKSSRMGRNKALLPFGGSPTLAHYQYARLSPLFASTFLSAKTADPFPKEIPVIIDDPSLQDFAPTVGFVSVFRALENERIFAVGIDTPFIDVAVIRALVAADQSDADAVIARTKMGIHPLCGLYHRRVMSRFESMVASGEHKLGKMLHTGNVIYVDFEDEALFANLNHPNEYDAAVERFNQGDHPEAVGEEKRF